MPVAAANDYIQVPGLVHILAAYPSNYTSLFKIGESLDGVMVRKIPIYGEVKGDRYGGEAGPPIEKQFFGERCEFELNMSRWSPTEIAKLERLGGLLTDPGVIPLSVVGALMLRDRAIRILLYCFRDPTLSINMPCCLWSAPKEDAKGTKYASCRLGMEAHRAPEGYWASAKAGVVYDVDTDGVPSPYNP
jgi:hypothetical protein